MFYEKYVLFQFIHLLYALIHISFFVSFSVCNSQIVYYITFVFSVRLKPKTQTIRAGKEVPLGPVHM